MNVILLEKIKKLGDIGDEVSVKSGYARNFLVPNRKALYATPDNKKYFEEKKNDIKSLNDKLVKDSLDKVKKISDQEVVLIRAASDSGQLYGSVSTKDIVNSLAKQDIYVEKNKIDLNKSVKNLTYEKVTINLHPEVSCEIILNVARSSEEASKQRQIGKAVITNSEMQENKDEVSEDAYLKNEGTPDIKKEKSSKSTNSIEADDKTIDTENLLKKNKIETDEIKDQTSN